MRLLFLNAALLISLHQVSAIHSFVGQACESDANCADGGWESCIDSVCKHKDAFPLMEQELWGLIMVAFVLFYTNLAGLSGGGVLVPVGMFFFRQDAKTAIALSNISICLASGIRFIMFSS